FQPTAGSNGINQSCLVLVRRLQNLFLHRYYCVRLVHHVEFKETCVSDLREAVRLEQNFEPVLPPNESPVFVVEAGARNDVRNGQSATRPQPAMDSFQHRAAILSHSEHVAEVHDVVTFRRLPLQHVSLNEIEAARTTVRMALTRSLDLLRAHL